MWNRSPGGKADSKLSRICAATPASSSIISIVSGILFLPRQSESGANPSRLTYNSDATAYIRINHSHNSETKAHTTQPKLLTLHGDRTFPRKWLKELVGMLKIDSDTGVLNDYGAPSISLFRVRHQLPT